MARFVICQRGAAAFGVGTVWPKEECTPLVGRVLEKGRSGLFSGAHCVPVGM